MYVEIVSELQDTFKWYCLCGEEEEHQGHLRSIRIIKDLLLSFMTFPVDEYIVVFNRVHYLSFSDARIIRTDVLI